MDYGNHSLPQLLITHQVSLSDLCFYFDLPEETFTGPDDTSRITNFLTTLQNSNRLPELYSYLETSYPQVQWQAPQGGINLAAARDIEIEVGGDMVAGNKIIETNHYIQEQVIVQGVEITDQEQLPPEDGDPPYKGLSYFTEADAEWFFGREAATANLINRLHDLNFLAVIGASGSGKSSLIRAGVIPVMKRHKTLPDGTEPPLGQWEVRTLTPTTRPLTKLATTVFPDDHTQQATFQEQALQTPNALRQALDAQSQTDHKLFLFIDQFEEVFTLCHDEAERQAFIDNLLTLTAESTTVKIIMTFRADFYADCLRYEGLRTILKTNQEPLGAMTLQELTDAVLGPIAKGNWQFQEGLIEEIMEEVGEEPGRLPLLSHALLETWRRRRGRMLTLSAYREAGKIQGAIAQTAEQTYTQLTAEHQKVTQQIFLRLTELGEGTQDTRRRVKRDELGSSDTIKLVTQQLANARLITTSQEEVDVAHEALIREWPRLREWLDANREGLRLHRQLTEASHEWVALDRDTGLLYRGARLTQTQEWAAENPEQLNQLESEFLQSSQQALDAEEQAKEEARLREIAQAKQLAETERKRAEEQEQAASSLRQRLFYVIGALILAAILGVAAVFFGFNANQSQLEANNNLVTATLAQGEAQQQAAAAQTSQAIAIDAEGTAEFNEQQAIESAGIASTRAVESEWAQATAVSAEATAVVDRNRALREQQISLAQLLAGLVPQVPINFSANDTELAALFALQATDINQRENGQLEWLIDDNLRNFLTDPSVQHNHILKQHESIVYGVTFSPNGRFLASASDDQTVRLWDLQNPNLDPIILDRHEAPVFAVAFSPDGRFLASADGAGIIYLWDRQNPTQPPHSLAVDETSIYTVAFSPDGQTLASGSADQAIRIWDLQDVSAPPTLLTGHTAPVWSVTFSPDGQTLASGSDDTTIRLWNLQSIDTAPQVLDAHDKAVLSVAFSPDGQTLASGSDDTTIRLWDLQTLSSEGDVLTGHRSTIWSVKFSPDGQTLASGSDDTSIRLWDLQDTSEPTDIFLSSGFTIFSVAFSPNGDTLASASFNAVIRLWDLREPSIAPTILEEHTEWVRTVTFSPDGNRLASAGDDNTIHMWDMLNSPPSLAVFSGHTDWIQSVAFSRDSHIFASGGRDDTVRIWNLQNPTALPILFEEHQADVLDLAISPNGQIASADRDAIIYLWNPDTNTPPIQLQGHGSAIWAIDFSPDGQTLISGDENGQILLWDMGNPQANPITIQAHPSEIWSLAFSPDGQQFASAGSDATVRLWDLSDLSAAVHIFSGHELAVLSVEFSPDGRILASGGDDSTIRLWNLQNYDADPTILDDHTGWVLGLSFSPDGQTLASGSTDDTVMLWAWSLDNLVSFACEELTWRNMSLAEWERFVGTEPYECSCRNRPPHPTAVEAGIPISAESCPLYEP